MLSLDTCLCCASQAWLAVQGPLLRSSMAQDALWSRVLAAEMSPLEQDWALESAGSPSAVTSPVYQVGYYYTVR